MSNARPATKAPEELQTFTQKSAEDSSVHTLSASTTLDTVAPHISKATASGWSRRNLNLAWTPESREWGLALPDNTLTEWLTSGRKLRVLGECWGMSEVSHPADGGSVLVPPKRKSAHPRVRWSTPEHDAVTCSIGCTFDEVHDFLAQQGGDKALANQPGYSGLTVMGTLGTGGHGSGLCQGPLESLVRAVTLASIRSPGHRIRFDHGDRDFACAVHHLGRLGPVLEVELAVRDAFRIAEERPLYVLGQQGRNWQDDLRELIHDAVVLQHQPEVHSAELWIAPYPRRAGELVAALGVRRYSNQPLSTTVKRPPTLRYEVLQAAGRAVATLLTTGLEHLTPWVLEQAVRSTHTPEPVVMDARTGLDFGAPNVNRMGSIEAAVELERGPDAVIATLQLLASLAQRRCYVFSPLGVRFVGAGRDGSLSPHSGRNQTLHIEVPTLGNEELFHGHEVLAPVQRMLATRFDGRPHWGQRIYLAHTELARLWPTASHQAMARSIERLDPQGAFANPLVDGMLATARNVRV